MDAIQSVQLTVLLTCKTASMEGEDAEGLYWGHLKEKRGLEDMAVAVVNTIMFLKETEPG